MSRQLGFSNILRKGRFSFASFFPEENEDDVSLNSEMKHWLVMLINRAKWLPQCFITVGRNIDNKAD